MERANAFLFAKKECTLVGPELKVGDAAPAFTAVANDLSTYTFTPGDGTVYIINSVPSLDTGVCATQTRTFNQQAAELPGVSILTVSRDLPFAQKRWCGAEGIEKVQTLSDYRDQAFAPAYGTLIKEWNLCSRAVFVVDKAGKIAYAQYVPAAGQEPEYGPALEAARAAAAK